MLFLSKKENIKILSLMLVSALGVSLNMSTLHASDLNTNEVKSNDQDSQKHYNSYYSYSTPKILEGLVIENSDLCGTNSDVIALYGKNFNSRTTPKLRFGEQGNLTICSYSSTEIIASCPNSSCNPGDYLLQLTTFKGWGAKRKTTLSSW